MIARLLRSWLCVAIHGHHELYRAWSPDRLYQRCLVCGHETHGWDVTPRRFHRV